MEFGLSGLVGPLGYKCLKPLDCSWTWKWKGDEKLNLGLQVRPNVKSQGPGLPTWVAK